MNSHHVRLSSGVIGVVVTSLKPKELLNRVAMVTYELDGEIVKQYGIVSYIYEQHESELEL